MTLHTPETLEQAIWRTLLGTPLQQIEDTHSIEPHILLPLVEAYRAAGQQVLTRVSGRHWHYWRIPLVIPMPTSPLDNRHRRKADEVLTHDVGPLCMRMLEQGLITHWWFMRKGDGGTPHLRLRIYGEEPMLSQTVVPLMEQEFAHLCANGRIGQWSTLIYEPETMIFGGTEGMDLAHDFFHHDACWLLRWLHAELDAENPYAHRHRPEASLVVLHHLLHGAGLDLFEQLDVWMQMRKYRVWKTSATPEQREKNINSLMHLIWAPKHELEDFFGVAQAQIVEEWGTAFKEIGKELAQLNREGKLHRGLRNVLASYIIFHWNRMSFNVAMQSELTILSGMIHTERANQSDQFMKEVTKVPTH